MEPTSSVASGEIASPSSVLENSAASKRSQPTKVLPSDRLALDRQLAAIAAFAAVSESKDGSPVTNEEAGAVVQPNKMAAATIAMTNAFFCAIGMLTRQDNGTFAVSTEAMAYFKAQSGLSPQPATYKLRPLLERQWFYQIIGPRLKLGPQDVQTVYKIIGEACSANKDHLKRIEILVDLICEVGLARKDGNQLRAGAVAVGGSEERGAEKDRDESENESASAGSERYTLTLSAEKNRRIVIYAPPSVSAAELKRIQSWLSFQLIVPGDGDSA